MTDNWRNRKQHMACGRCMWWVRKGTTTIGRCRRNAPSADAPGWPIVMDSDFCGEFRLDESFGAASNAPRVEEAE